MRGPHKNELWLFSNTKMNVTNSKSREDRWKEWAICLVFIFPSSVMVLKLSKKVYFFQFCANLSKKPKSIKVIYIYAPGSSHCTVLGNGMVYRGLSHSSWEISNQTKFLIQQKFSKILGLLWKFWNISETASYSMIKNNIFLKCVKRHFRCIYVSKLLE